MYRKMTDVEAYKHRQNSLLTRKNDHKSSNGDLTRTKYDSTVDMTQLKTAEIAELFYTASQGHHVKAI